MIRIAVIGTGAVAEIHIQAFKAFQDRCEVRVLADLYPEKAEKLARNHGISAVVCKDFREAVARDDIDLVSVCLPPSVHAEAAVAALEAGKHVIVEKPMASSLEECDAMIQAAEKNGRILASIAQNRYKIPMMKVKKILESGAAGRVLHATANSSWWRGQNYYDLWWRGTWNAEAGGCTMNHAVHHIDLLRWALGMPEEVTAVFTNANHDNSETEDLSIAILHYPKGALAQITASIVDHGEEQELVFQAERARISVPWRVKAMLPLENGFPKEDPDTERELAGALRFPPRHPLRRTSGTDRQHPAGDRREGPPPRGWKGRQGDPRTHHGDLQSRRHEDSRQIPAAERRSHVSERDHARHDAPVPQENQEHRKFCHFNNHPRPRYGEIRKTECRNQTV